jgi:DNA replication protein DnaC
VGKSHLAVALGREAIVRGYSTLFVPATGWSRNWHERMPRDDSRRS